MSLNSKLQDAERKARQRDAEHEKVLTEEEMSQANVMQSKANARGMKLVPDRKVKNRAKFVQIIQANWAYLKENKYLTAQEQVFLLDLVPHIGFHSNAIVADPKQKSPIPINQTEIAALLGVDKSKVSRIVKKLVEKGIVSRAESGLEDNNVKSYSLFVNPHVLFCGDRDKVNETLKAIFIKPMKMKILKNLPEKLF